MLPHERKREVAELARYNNLFFRVSLLKANSKIIINNKFFTYKNRSVPRRPLLFLNFNLSIRARVLIRIIVHISTVIVRTDNLFINVLSILSSIHFPRLVCSYGIDYINIREG